MSTEANKALVCRYFEDASSNPAACDEILASVVRLHAIRHATVNPDADSSSASERAAYGWLKTVWGSACPLTN